MILRSAGFVTSDLIFGRNAVNFAYILYLRGRAEKMPPADLERLVRRWYAMSILRGRYTGSPETAFDFDIRQVEQRGLGGYTESVVENELPESFWTGMLPQLMDTSSGQSPYFLAYQAAQVKLGDKGFLSRDITTPEKYFGELAEQSAGGKKKYGGMTSRANMEENLRMHCLPTSLLDGKIPTYDDFLEERRQLMALKIKRWFEAL
jgi:hypothetical protein